MLPTFLKTFIGEIAKKTLYTVLALIFIGGSQRVAEYYDIKPAVQALSVVDGVLIQQRSTVVAQGPVVVVSDSKVLTADPSATTAQ